MGQQRWRAAMLSARVEPGRCGFFPENLQGSPLPRPAQWSLKCVGTEDDASAFLSAGHHQRPKVPGFGSAAPSSKAR